jgi:hypothetical protein
LIITGNYANNGGGIYCFGHASPTITSVKIYDNAAINGGGICCVQHCSPLITQTMIYSNAANEDGGGLYFNDSCYAVISESKVEENYISYAGAGIFCANSSDIQTKNSTIRNNGTDDQGGGLYCEYSNPYLERVTITGNSAYEGGGIFVWNSQPELVNSILWNDSKPEIYLFADPQDSSSIAIAHSDIGGGPDSIYITLNSRLHWLEGNFNSDPLFIDPFNDDYRLQDLSPCREVGVQEIMFVYNNDQDTLVVPALAYLDNAPDLGASETSITSLTHFKTQKPFGYRLEQNYPNPFNAATNFRFSIPAADRVVIEIYNLLGQKVMILLDEYLTAGVHQVRVETNDLATGIYLYQIKTGSFVQSRKMMLLR